MACINPDGTLTAVARAVLAAAEAPATAPAIAAAAALPLYRVRASLRELGRARLVACTSETWQRTEAGSEALALDAC